ncbi:hypothetical protein BpHYR1_034456 [Brachionus plicatilis]|uniref:Uncharacterized protein n=1 Tax=Brachionus plicatilis TaxID=10195 RepID=A0A3M7SBW7_BRAPC|nr:hypothetical protein BpHYR1_034456 [Brachionus plicatilis]
MESNKKFLFLAKMTNIQYIIFEIKYSVDKKSISILEVENSDFSVLLLNFIEMEKINSLRKASLSGV